MQYIILDSNNICVNVIVYDGESEYDPGNNFTMIPYDNDANPWIGWQLNDDGSWSEPTQEQNNIDTKSSAFEKLLKLGLTEEEVYALVNS